MKYQTNVNVLPNVNVYYCPNCDSNKLAVVDSRHEKYLRRRRKCLECGYAFSTIEVHVDEFNKLVGKRGKRK